MDNHGPLPDDHGDVARFRQVDTRLSPSDKMVWRTSHLQLSSKIGHHLLLLLGRDETFDLHHLLFELVPFV